MFSLAARCAKSARVGVALIVVSLTMLTSFSAAIAGPSTHNGGFWFWPNVSLDTTQIVDKRGEKVDLFGHYYYWHYGRNCPLSHNCKR